MKKALLLLSVAAMASCHTAKEYTVRSYNQETDGNWEIEAATRRKDSSFRKSTYFITECKPDSAGVRFMFRKGDEIAKYKTH